MYNILFAKKKIISVKEIMASICDVNIMGTISTDILRTVNTSENKRIYTLPALHFQPRM